MARKKRKFTDNERTIFQAGVSEGMSRQRRVIKKLKESHDQAMIALEVVASNNKKSNMALWEEVLRLDIKEPVAGVLIPRVTAESILAVLEKHKSGKNKNHRCRLATTMYWCIQFSDNNELQPLAGHLETIKAESLEQEE